jgi:hydrogenase maturation protease
VFGVGDTRCGDAGAGVLAAELATARVPEGVHIVATGAIGPATMEDLDLEGFSHIVILNHLDVGRSPGTVVTFDSDDLSPCATRSVYQFGGVANVLISVGQTARAPEEAVVVAVQPVTVDLGAPISMEVLLALPRMAERAREIVHGWLEGRPVGVGVGTPVGDPCLEASDGRGLDATASAR